MVPDFDFAGWFGNLSVKTHITFIDEFLGSLSSLDETTDLQIFIQSHSKEYITTKRKTYSVVSL